MLVTMSNEMDLGTRKIIVKLYCDIKSMSEVGKIIGKSKSTVHYVINQ